MKKLYRDSLDRNLKIIIFPFHATIFFMNFIKNLLISKSLEIKEYQIKYVI